MAGKEVRALQLNHALPKTVPELKSVALKSVMAVQSFHASPKLVPDEREIAGKVVRELQLLHALPKCVPLETSRSEGREVSEEQPRQQDGKLSPLERSLVRKEVSPEQ